MSRRRGEPDDPLLLVGVAVPGGAEAWREMACVFAEELARTGRGEEQILRLFRTPFYAGPHGAWRRLGEPEVRRIVAETVAAWGRVRTVVREPRSEECGHA